MRPSLVLLATTHKQALGSALSVSQAPIARKHAHWGLSQSLTTSSVSCALQAIIAPNHTNSLSFALPGTSSRMRECTPLAKSQTLEVMLVTELLFRSSVLLGMSAASPGTLLALASLATSLQEA